MTISEMLKQSVILTLLGMAVVFGFLWFMIVCVNATAKLIHRIGWDKDVQPNEVKSPGGAVKPEITAAITAALTEYQKND
ncbi:MAG: OadG family protein [Treponema sp.]|jgi:sodium pump decarboxylase gamma subunit|nr:OadG family protein [Treponema sp.]